MIRLFLTIFACIVFVSDSFASERCESALISVSYRTEKFVAYLGRLTEARVIKDLELEHFLYELDGSGKFINPISEEQALLDYDSYIHREGLQKLIDQGEIDKEILRKWLRKTLEARGVARIEREETRVETQDIHQKMIFNLIEPGDFEMGEPGKTVHVKITEPFEMMSTQVTQKIWTLVMGRNPSHFADGPNTITMEIYGRSVRMQPDNPVERVSWSDIQTFLLILNELSANDDDLIRTLIQDHRKGSVFRLPTEAQWEFVTKARGKSNGRYHFGDDESLLQDYAWFHVNSAYSTHPVAEKKPLIIDGKPFYDLHGNVSERVNDIFGIRESGKALIDPTGPTNGTFHVIRGGSWCGNARSLESVYRCGAASATHEHSLGFRIIRLLTK